MRAQVGRGNATRARGRAVILGLVLAAVLVASAMPAATAISADGIWIFPHSRQADAVDESLSSAFYTSDESNDILDDSFFADSLAGSANIKVDLYNPTSATIENVQLFAAISDGDLFTEISFAWGSGGEVSYTGLDSLSTGTPFGLDAHDVYPAYFASYSVGDIDAGTSGIQTVWVNVTGDFAGGLIVHLDYTGKDASDNSVVGPYTADMNIFENGECAQATFSLSKSVSDSTPAPGGVVKYTITWQQTGGDDASDVTVTDSLPGEVAILNVSQGSFSGQDWIWSIGNSSDGSSGTATVNVTVSDLLLDGDAFANTVDLSWDSCGGNEGSQTASASATVETTPSGDVEKASFWKKEYKRAEKGKGKHEFSNDDLTLFLKRIALHSEVFTYGEWDGTAPTGAEDEGDIDIDSFDEALDVLKAHDNEDKLLNKAQRELFALWLNVASGKINLDTSLKVKQKGCSDDDEEKECKGKSAFEAHTGLKSPGSSYDTPGEIIAFAEDQVNDWADGSGASKSDLKLARNLCLSVIKGWLIPA